MTTRSARTWGDIREEPSRTSDPRPAGPRVAAAASLVAGFGILFVDGDDWRYAAAIVLCAWAACRVATSGRTMARNEGVLLAGVDVLVLVFAAAAAPELAIGFVLLMFVDVVAAGFCGPAPAATAAFAGAGGVLLVVVAVPGSLGATANGFIAVGAFVGAAVLFLETPARRSRPQEHQVDPAATLFAVCEAAAGDDFEALLDAIGDAFTALGGPTGWVLWLRPPGSDLAFERRWGTGSRDDAALEVFSRELGATGAAGTVSDGVMAELVAELESGRTVVVNGIDDVDTLQRDLLESVGVGACVFMPLGRSDSLWGTLAGFRRRRSGPFQPAEVDLLVRLGHLVGSELVSFDERRNQLAGHGPKATVASYLVTLAAELRDPVSVIAGFAATLAQSDHRFGRLERRRYQRLIEAQGVSLGRTVDELAVVVDAEAAGLRPFLRPIASDDFRKEFESRSNFDDRVGLRIQAAGPIQGDLRLVALSAAGLAGVMVAHCAGDVVVSVDSMAGAGRVRVVGSRPDGAWAELAGLLQRVEAGDASAIWSGRTGLTLACAVTVAAAHGGSLGLDTTGPTVAFILDMAPVVVVDSAVGS